MGVFDVNVKGADETVTQIDATGGKSVTSLCDVTDYNGQRRHDTRLARWAGNVADTDPQVAIDPRDTALLMYTLGTTGRSNGVQLSHQGLNYMRLCESLEPELRWPSDDVLLKRALVEMQCQFMQFYGTTETGGPHTYLWAHREQLPSSFDDATRAAWQPQAAALKKAFA